MSTDTHSQPEATTDTVVDRENPWPGLHAYDERGKDFFKGRRDVARDLLRLIIREDLVLLYGISGLGKTSLLRAGVFPELPANYLPVYLRLNFVSADAQDARDGRALLTSADLAAQVVAATQESARQRNVEAPTRPPMPERGMWEYFRRSDDGFWGPGGLLMTPVLVFDQFEELFTRVESPEAAQRYFEDFLRDLANLESGREPKWYESACATDENIERPAYTRQPGVCKVVLSFREDYLANVKGLSRIIPSIDRIFLRLEPMTRKAAARAICEAGQHLIEGKGNTATLRTSVRIIRKVTRAPGRLAGTATVDPALLSLFCRELNEKRKVSPGKLIDRSLVDSAEASQILKTFYAEAMCDVLPVTRKFVEDTMVLPGMRCRWPAAEPNAFAAGVPPADLDTLTRRRILRRDIAGGIARFELTHDVLVDVALESRGNRLDQEKLAQERETLAAKTEETRRRLEFEIARTERQRKRAFRFGLTAGVSVLLLFVTVLALIGISRLEHEQRARNWADAAYTEAPRNARLSTVLGLRALKESESARAPMPLALMALNNAVRLPHLQQRIALKQAPQTMAVSADGTNVALLAGTRLIELWKAPAFAAPPARLNPTDDVFSMTFDRGGTELVIVYRSTAVDRVDVNAADVQLQRLAPAIGANRTVIAAAVSPGGERLLLTSGDPTGELQWLSTFDRRAASWQPPIVSPKQANFILAGDAITYATLKSDGQLSFAPGGPAPMNLGKTTLVGLNTDGSRLFAVHADAGVPALQVVSLAQAKSWNGPLPSSAAAVAGLFAGDRLTLTQVDGRVSVWDLTAKRMLFDMKDAPHVALSDDTERLLTWSAGDTVDIWDARNGRSIERVGSHDDPVSGAALAGHGGLLLTIAGQGLYVWNRPQVDRVLPKGTQTPMTATFSVAGDKLITASAQSVQVYDAHSGSRISSIVSPDPITALALAPDDKHIAIGTAKGDILVRTLGDTPDPSARLSGGGAITALAFGASERQLAWAAQVAPETTVVVLRNIATKEDVVSQQIPGIVVATAVDGQRVAVGLHGPHNYRTAEQNSGAAGARTVVQLVSSAANPVGKASSMTAPSPQPSVMPPASRPPAETDTPPPPPLMPLPPPLLAPPPFGAAPTSGEQPRTPERQCEQGSVSLSRNLGFGAAVTSCERTVMEWRNLNQAMPLKVERPVTRVAVSPDGNYLALAYVDGGITLHHTALPSRFATIAGPGEEITALAFDMPGARLAATRGDGSMTVFQISGPELRGAAERLAGTLQPTADECLRLFGASDQCEEIGAWRLVTQRIIQALRGK